MTKAQQKEKAREGVIKALKESIDPKKGIVIVLKKVSASGMSREFAIYSHDLEFPLTLGVAIALSKKRKVGWRDTLTMRGCGMDMAFALAYQLTDALYTEEEKKSLTGNGGGCLPFKSL